MHRVTNGEEIFLFNSLHARYLFITFVFILFFFTSNLTSLIISGTQPGCPMVLIRTDISMGAELGPNGLQMLSTDDKTRH